MQQIATQAAIVNGEELDALWRRLKADPENIALKDEILTHYMGFARRVIRNYVRNWGVQPDIDEFLGDALKGLGKAAVRYDVDRNGEFTTYAIRKTRRAIHDACGGRKKVTEKDKLRLDQVEQLTHKLGRTPNEFELANHLGLSEEELLTQLIDSRSEAKPAQFEDSIRNSADSRERAESDEFESEHFRERLPQLIQDAFSIMSKVEQRRVRKHFLDGMSQTEIALEEGVSESAISQSIKSALAKAQEHLPTPRRLIEA